MSDILQHRGRRAAQGAADPLDALPSSAASEIVRAARALLQDPTRPVTPAETSRHLLRSSCSYSNRPQTSGSLIGSHEFISAAASDGMCWGPDSSMPSSSSGRQPDIWVADDSPVQPYAAWGSAGLSGPSQGPLCSLPGVRRSTASAPGLQLLPSITTSNSSSHSSKSKLRAASAGGAVSSSRLSELGSLAPMRAISGTTAAQAPLTCMVPAVTTAIAAEAIWPAEEWHGSSRAPSDSDAGVASVEKSFVMQAARGSSSPSSESSVMTRPSSSCCASSRGSSSCGNRSRLCSRGDDRPGPVNELTAAEAELQQMVHDADAAAAGGAHGVLCADHQEAAASCSQWQQSILHVVQRMQALSLSPADAAALLQCCVQLQCLLDTAADWGCLQQWLELPSAQAARAPGMPQLHPSAGTAVNASNSSSSSSATSPSSRDGSLSGTRAGSLQGLHGTLLQALVRLVDSKKADVLVKVGAMLLGITPPGSQMLLPAAKMLYTLSKDSSNDSRFRHHGVLRPLLCLTAALSSAAAQHQQQHTTTVLLYCSGCLKNISTDVTNQKSLGRLGGVSTMAKVLMDQVAIAQAATGAADLSQIQQSQHVKQPQHQAAAQVAVQAAAVLRNLAVPPTNSQYFGHQHGAALQALISLLQPFQHDSEVLLNVSRCLSKLSLSEDCMAAMVSVGRPQQPLNSHTSQQSCAGIAASLPGNRFSTSSSGTAVGTVAGPCCSPSSAGPVAVAQIVQALLTVQATQPRQWPMGVRLAFTLGQLTTYHPEARTMVAAVPMALNALPQLVLDLSKLQQQQQQQVQEAQQQRQQQHQTDSAEDLMTKVLRVMANLSIDRTIGPALAAKQATADALLAVMSGYEYETNEELVLNATAALTNLAFYETPSNKVLQMDADALLLSLLPLLTSGNEESMCEAARAVANTARASPAVRAALVVHEHSPPQPDDTAQAQQLEEPSNCAACQDLTSQQVTAGPYVLKSLVLLLDHSSWQVVCSAAGALVNLAALAEAGTVLSSVGLAPALVAALRRAQQVWCTGGEVVGHTPAAAEEEGYGMCTQAAELLLQCIGNMATASADAVSYAILGSSGARCAELSCSSEDLASFSCVVGGLATEGVQGPATCHNGVPERIRASAKAVGLSLATLWGL